MSSSFPSLLKRNNSSYYFWDHVGKYSGEIKIYIGNIDINNASDHKILTEQIMNDLILKCDNQKCFLKLFHDIGYNDQPILHFLLIIDNDQVEDLKKTLIYATSKMTHIEQNISNHHDQINHYLEHTDIYKYRTVQRYQL